MGNNIYCYKCKKIIIGQSEILFGRYWHPACMICMICKKEVTPQKAEMRDDFLIHSHCIPNKRSATSPAPAWLIAPPISISAKNNSLKPTNNNYKPGLDYFECYHCKKTIGLNSFVNRGNIVYHANCFKIDNDLICDICHLPIRGAYYFGNCGEIYCAYHIENLDRCTACHRPICNELTGGGTRYPDGRLVCNICRKTAIDKADQVQTSMKMVRDVLGKNGLLIDETLFPVKLIDREEMRAIPRNACPTALGLFSAYAPVNNHRRIESIFILWGRPANLFESTLAHELGHAWFYLNHVDNLSTQLEEGLCNVLHYLILINKPKIENLPNMQSMFTNPDPIYGEGFRLAEKCLNRFSVGGLMRYVAKHHALP